MTAEHSVMMAEAGFPIAGISKPRGTKSRPGDFGGGRAMGRPPYTADGITRLLCARAGCGRRAHATWGACADDNVQRPLCPECDVELNAWVLNWFGDPDAEHKLAAYRRRMETNIGRPLDTAKEGHAPAPPPLTDEERAARDAAEREKKRAHLEATR